MIDDAPRGAKKFDDFAKLDGRTDRRTDTPAYRDAMDATEKGITKAREGKEKNRE